MRDGKYDKKKSECKTPFHHPNQGWIEKLFTSSCTAMSLGRNVKTIVRDRCIILAANLRGVRSDSFAISMYHLVTDQDHQYQRQKAQNCHRYGDQFSPFNELAFEIVF